MRQYRYRRINRRMSQASETILACLIVLAGIFGGLLLSIGLAAL